MDSRPYLDVKYFFNGIMYRHGFYLLTHTSGIFFYYGTKCNKKYFCFLIFTDPERRMLKNILRIQASSRRKLSVFGLFDVDAKLYVVTLTIIANYTFVLLQFAFVK